MKLSKYHIAIVVLAVLGVLLFQPKKSQPVSVLNESTLPQLQENSEETRNKSLSPNTTNSVLPASDGSSLPQARTVESDSAIAEPSTEEETESSDPLEEETGMTADEALKIKNETKIKIAFHLPNTIVPNPGQKALFELVEKKYTPVLEMHLNKMEVLLSEDQRKARNEALLRSVFDGDSGQTMLDVERNAMNLTGDQEQALLEVKKEYYSARNSARLEMEKYLSKEQKIELPSDWIVGRQGF